MSSADFRHIAVKGKVHKAERLFRAAVSAFCALPRPSRSEIAQLEDLTLPLFDAQSKEAKRFASAALSDAAEAPNALIRRLCEEPVDIAAALLIRSKTLSDVDLIALICRHGLPHARAIARRSHLHPSIAALIRALEAQDLRDRSRQDEAETAPPSDQRPALELVRPQPGLAAERMRDRLRGFMASPTTVDFQSMTPEQRAKVFARLKMTALTGNPAFFRTALADALDIEFGIAQDITTSGSYTSLIAALKALALDDEQAFLLTVAVFPGFFTHAEAVRLFVERFRLLPAEAARELLRGWRAESAARSFLRSQPQQAGDADEKPVPTDHLKAS